MKPEKSYSLLAVLAIILCLFLWPVCNGFYNPFTWDFFGYYIYLPLQFIYHQIPLNDLSLIESLNAKYHISSSLYQFNHHPETHSFSTRYPIGVSYFYFPFFVLAHVYALNAGIVADGFSDPYQISCLIGGMMYFALALFLLRWSLLRFFDDVVVALVLILICFSTNMMAEGFDRLVASPHALGFVAYSFVFFFTIKWHETPKPKYAFLLGISFALSTVVRASELICLLIPLLWNTSTLKELKIKLNMVWKEYKRHLLIMVLGAFLIFLPQMLYWKIHSGQFIFYSYQNAGEGFDFFSPHTLSFLFSFRKGWFIYTPILVFAYLGFYFLYQNHKKIFFPLMVFSILSLWIISSWSCWYYACSYGNRGIVQTYAVLLFPLSSFFQEIFLGKRIVKYLVILLLLFFTSLNLFQYWQFKNYILECDRMTWTYYKNAFGAFENKEENKKNLLVDRTMNRQHMAQFYNLNYHETVLFQDDFERNTHDSLSRQFMFSGHQSLVMNSAYIYSQAFEIPYQDITEEDHAWIKVRFKYYLPDSSLQSNAALVINFLHGRKAYQWSAYEIKKQTYKTRQWNEAEFEYLTPEVRSTHDELQIYFWYIEGQQSIYIDDVQVMSYTVDKST